jgi:hypothetical protein
MFNSAVLDRCVGNSGAAVHGSNVPGRSGQNTLVRHPGPGRVCHHLDFTALLFRISRYFYNAGPHFCLAQRHNSSGLVDRNWDCLGIKPGPQLLYQPAFEFYAPAYGFDPKYVIDGIMSRNDPQKYLADVDQLKGKARVWFVFTHNFVGAVNEQNYMFYHLKKIGVKCAEYSPPGATVYLFNLEQIH